jgi:hypothetical protein
MTRLSLTLSAAALSVAFCNGAQAAVQLTEMNFDLWCQEEQHLPPDRCDKRLPEDDAAFNAYRAKIENYEVPYLQDREQKENMNRIILHNDPVDHPTRPENPPDPTPVDAPPK